MSVFITFGRNNHAGRLKYLKLGLSVMVTSLLTSRFLADTPRFHKFSDIVLSSSLTPGIYHDGTNTRVQVELQIVPYRTIQPKSAMRFPEALQVWIGVFFFLLMVSCNAPGCSWERSTDNRGLNRHRASCCFYKRASSLASRKRQDRAKEASIHFSKANVPESIVVSDSDALLNLRLSY
jgi:hypothetical protein